MVRGPVDWGPLGLRGPVDLGNQLTGDLLAWGDQLKESAVAGGGGSGGIV